MAHGRAALSDVSKRLSGPTEDLFHHTLASPEGLSLARVEYKEEDLASATTDYYSLPLGPTPGMRKECIYLVNW